MKKLIASIVLIFLLLSQAAFAASPEEELKVLKQSLAGEIGNQAIGSCQSALVPVYDLELIEFLKFLDLNFQNKSATDSLTNTAIARYKDYKLNIQRYFRDLQPGITTGGGESSLNTTEINAYQSCSKITNSYLSLGKTRMIEHIKNTNAQKRTTVMLEKYKAINSELRDLNLHIAKMYGLFMTFKSKLPGFLQECITI